MLIVTKKAGDSVQIGADVVVKVLSSRSGGVRLGIEAPDSMAITHQAPASRSKVPESEQSPIERKAV